MEVNWYNEKNKCEKVLINQKRQFLDITFTGDSVEDAIKREFGHIYVRDIMNKQDTVHGIKFHFSDKSRYASFVDVLDICNMEDVKVYFASDDGITVFYPSPSPHKKGVILTTPIFLRM